MLARGRVLLAVVAVLAYSADARGEESATPQRPIRVAIFDDAGGSPKGPPNLERCLSKEAGFATKRVKAADIRAGVLKDFDVVIMPGGSGSKQAAALEEAGREKIRKFVDDGHGYLGICAGAYLASADYSWSLHLLDAKVLDRKHWNRGNGDVQLKFTGEGRTFHNAEADQVTVRYAQGPLLAPGEKAEIPDYEALATFETEVVKNGASPGVMKGTTAAARGEFGKGRVFCYSPHPESYGNLDHYIQAAVRWTARKDEK